MKLLKFYTPHCTHCPNVKKLLEEKNIEFEGINLFDYPEKSIKYKVLGVPTLMLVNDDGAEVIRHVGGKGVEEFLQQHGLLETKEGE